MKPFTDSHVEAHGAIAGAGRIYVSFPDDVIYAPLDWQKRGLQQSASGYGAKLTTRYKIQFNGKLYRIYATCYGNAVSCWFKPGGRTIYVD